MLMGKGGDRSPTHPPTHPPTHLPIQPQAVQHLLLAAQQAVNSSLA